MCFKRQSCKTRETKAAATPSPAPLWCLSCLTPSVTHCGHWHVSRVSLNGLRKRETARSLAGKCKTEQRDLLHLPSLHSQEHNTSCLEDTQKYKFNNIKANVQRDIFY